MEQLRAVFWLGNLDRGYTRLVSNWQDGHDGSADSDPLISVTQSRLSPRDQQLVDQVLLLFDGTLEAFEGHGDREARVRIDRLALAVMSCIRAYIRERPSY